jgi:hypothetical protein
MGLPLVKHNNFTLLSECTSTFCVLGAELFNIGEILYKEKYGKMDDETLAEYCLKEYGVPIRKEAAV